MSYLEEDFSGVVNRKTYIEVGISCDKFNRGNTRKDSDTKSCTIICGSREFKG